LLKRNINKKVTFSLYLCGFVLHFEGKNGRRKRNEIVFDKKNEGTEREEESAYE